jgi:hypothetical protein
MDFYTLREVEAAALRIGLDGRTPALLAELQRAAVGCYLASNAQNEAKRYQDMAEGLKNLHAQLSTWEAVGKAIGKSRAYAWRVAHGDLTPSAEALARYQEYTKEETHVAL